MLIDIHTHKKQPENGVFSIYNAIYGVDDPSENQHQAYSYGFHPWYLEQVPLDDGVEAIRQTIQSDPRLIAIGEVGLDNKKGPSLDIQEPFFRHSILLAQSFGLPIIVHCVGMVDAILHLKKALKPNTAFIFHGFDKHPNTAKQLTDAGCHLAFGAALLRPTSKAALALKSIPRERIFLETDASSALISDLYARAAAILNVSETDLEGIIEENYRNAFPKKNNIF